MCARRTSTASSARPTIPEWKTVAFDEAGKVGAAQRRDRLSLGPGRPRRPRPMEPRSEGGARTAARSSSSCRCSKATAPARETAKVGFPYFGGIDSEHFPNNAQKRRAGAHRAGAAHRARQGRRASARRWWPRCSTCRWRTTASRAGSAGELAARTSTTTRPTRRRGRSASPARRARQVITVARQFADNAAQDAGQVDGDHRRRDEPLVPQRHELPRRHQHADDVRLHRQERRRLGALRGPGKAAPADRLDRARVRARLDPPAAPDEQHQLLLRAHRPVALREARHGRGALAAGRQDSCTAAA